MDLESNPGASQKTPIVCSHSKCGKSFPKPIELNLRTKNEQAHYEACPYCFWPVAVETVMLENTNVEWTENLSHNLNKRPSRPASCASKKIWNKSDKGMEPIKPNGCEHFIGYLETLPQNSTIPSGCLSCDALMKCILKKKRKIEER